MITLYRIANCCHPLRLSTMTASHTLTKITLKAMNYFIPSPNVLLGTRFSVENYRVMFGSPESHHIENIFGLQRLSAHSNLRHCSHTRSASHSSVSQQHSSIRSLHHHYNISASARVSKHTRIGRRSLLIRSQ